MTVSVGILGGGVIGLAIGWRLAQAGAHVTLFEKNLVGSGASHVSAGMITPSSEIRFGETKLLQLFLESLKLYPDFISELESFSNVSTDFRQTGSLMLAIDADDSEELGRLHDYQQEMGLKVEALSAEQVRELEPQLSTKFVHAVHARSECFLDSMKLIAALKSAFVKAGGRLVENSSVSELLRQGQKITGVKTEQASCSFDQVILASGTELFDQLKEELSIPLRPIKGQVVHLKNQTGPVLSHAVRTIHRYPVYLLPRSDGRLLIGATNEEKILDGAPKAGAVQDLLYGAWKILPAIDDMDFLQTIVGFRAATPDHAPLLGPTAFEGLSLALGMYRHGILLTPIIAETISQFILYGKSNAHLDYFHAERFAHDNRRTR